MVLYAKVSSQHELLHSGKILTEDCQYLKLDHSCLITVSLL